MVEALLERGRAALLETVEAVRSGQVKTAEGTPVLRAGFDHLENAAKQAIRVGLQFDPLRMAEYISELPGVLESRGGGRLVDVMERAVVDRIAGMMFGDVVDAVMSQYPERYTSDVRVWMAAGVDRLMQRGAPISAEFKASLSKMQDLDGGLEADTSAEFDDTLVFMIDQIKRNVRGPYVPRRYDDENPTDHELAQRLTEVNEFLMTRRAAQGPEYEATRAMSVEMVSEGRRPR
jgi:hypothetical protein